MRRPHPRTYGAVADINIANLVDVVLVLLIIFMISAPLLQSGIEINLPKTRASAVEKEAEGVVITIDEKGGVYINDVFANPGNFVESLRKAMAEKNSSAVYVRGDSSVAYGKVIEVVGTMKTMGIETIGLVTGHEEAPRKRR
jgi:biopolymer transport protein TolR